MGGADVAGVVGGSSGSVLVGRAVVAAVVREEQQCGIISCYIH